MHEEELPFWPHDASGRPLEAFGRPLEASRKPLTVHPTDCQVTFWITQVSLHSDAMCG